MRKILLLATLLSLLGCAKLQQKAEPNNSAFEDIDRKHVGSLIGIILTGDLPDSNIVDSLAGVYPIKDSGEYVFPKGKLTFRNRMLKEAEYTELNDSTTMEGEHGTYTRKNFYDEQGHLREMYSVFNVVSVKDGCLLENETEIKYFNVYGNVEKTNTVITSKLREHEDLYWVNTTVLDGNGKEIEQYTKYLPFKDIDMPSLK